MSRKRTLWSLLILFVCCAAFCVTAFAASCSIRVTVRWEEQPVSNLRVELCQVTQMQEGRHVLTEAFAELPVPVNALLLAETAEKVHAFALEKQVQTITQTTNDTGTADFTQLAEGLYLVFAAGGQSVKFRPYMVMLPEQLPSGPLYDVYSAPKSVSGNTRSVLVVKQWEDGNDIDGFRPESVQINLYQDGDAVRRVSLNDACSWQHLFEDLPADCVYTVTEDPVLEYTCTISETAEGFLVTNRYVPQDLPIEPDDHPDPVPDPAPDPVPDPDPAPDPAPDPEQPERIPQAGFQMWPIYGVMGLGTLMVVFGLTDLYLSREAEYEEYGEEYEEVCEEE